MNNPGGTTNSAGIAFEAYFRAYPLQLRNLILLCAAYPIRGPFLAAGDGDESTYARCLMKTQLQCGAMKTT
jgi:hypothetical protein